MRRWMCIILLAAGAVAASAQPPAPAAPSASIEDAVARFEKDVSEKGESETPAIFDEVLAEFDRRDADPRNRIRALVLLYVAVTILQRSSASPETRIISRLGPSRLQALEARLLIFRQRFYAPEPPASADTRTLLAWLPVNHYVGALTQYVYAGRAGGAGAAWRRELWQRALPLLRRRAEVFGCLEGPGVNLQNMVRGPDVAEYWNAMGVLDRERARRALTAYIEDVTGALRYSWNRRHYVAHRFLSHFLARNYLWGLDPPGRTMPTAWKFGAASRLREVLDNQVRSAEAERDPIRITDALSMLAGFEWYNISSYHMGSWDLAIHQAYRTVEAARRIPEPTERRRWEYRAQTDLAVTAAYHGDAVLAYAARSAALQTLREGDQQDWAERVITTLSDLAGTELDLGLFRAAREHVEEARGRIDRAPDPDACEEKEGEDLLVAEGRLALLTGSTQQARRSFLRAASIKERGRRVLYQFELGELARQESPPPARGCSVSFGPCSRSGCSPSSAPNGKSMMKQERKSWGNWPGTCGAILAAKRCGRHN